MVKTADQIDWSNPANQVSDHFTVKELIWLNQLNRLATVDDGLTDQIKANLLTLIAKMEVVREFLEKAIVVNSTYRSNAYSRMVGGFAGDVHTMGIAMDFTVESMTCDEAKHLILPMLEQWDMRLEDNGDGAGWCHMDWHKVINKRFFKP